MYVGRYARALLGSLAFALGVCLAPAGAAGPAFAVPPPGTIVQTETSGVWLAVVSRNVLGHGSDGTAFYQWHLSVYARNGQRYALAYASPEKGGPLEKVTQVNGGDKLWFPVATVRIVGFAQLMPAAAPQLVVQSHEMSADCGGATVSVFALGPNGVVPAASLRNGCELSAKIVSSGNGGATLALTGPYYGPNAAMCCPTKTKATATLAYRDGAWSQSPKYYELFVGKLPPQ